MVLEKYARRKNVKILQAYTLLKLTKQTRNSFTQNIFYSNIIL